MRPVIKGYRGYLNPISLLESLDLTALLKHLNYQLRIEINFKRGNPETPLDPQLLSHLIFYLVIYQGFTGIQHHICMNVHK